MTTPKLIAPTNDLLFKKTLASEDHKTILQGFIHDFFGLDVPLQDLTVQNPYNIQAFDLIDPDHPEEPGHELRQTLYDVAATCPAGDILTELQIRHETNYTLRAVYYALIDYIAHYNLPHAADFYGRIDRYSTLIPVHTMNILGFDLFDGPHPLTRLRLHDPDTGHRLTPDPITIGFFELPKPLPENDSDPERRFNLGCWRQYWLTGQALAGAPAYIWEAVDIIKLVHLTEQERAMITATDRQRDKIDAMIAYGENRGHERGLAQGIEQGIERGLAQGEQRAQSRLAEIMRRHPEADHQTILRLMAEADD